MGYGTEIDGCGRFMKYSLFFSNFVIFIGGVVVSSLCIWSLVDRVAWISDLVGTHLLTGAICVLLAGGIIVSLVAFFGCIGASREIKCMLLTYFIIVFLLFVTMLIGGILGYVFRENITSTIHRDMFSSIQFYDKNKAVRTSWDTAQSTLKCCGVEGWKNWQDDKVPISCCRENFNCTSTANMVRSAENTYERGCLNVTTAYVQEHAAIIGGVGIAVACLMFFGMVFSCALFKMIE